MEREISVIPQPQNQISKEEIVKQRLLDLPMNSVIWCIADLYEKKGTVEIVKTRGRRLRR